ncbi:MAG: tail fiber domain-containing protein [Bacteroidales bacterium]|jgi:hypothetical protein|nr:tail fiber domain-containing protein [Bacteroidales bacterium]
MKSLKFFTALLVLFTSVTFIQAQIKVLSDGTVKIGNSSAAKIQSNSNAALQLKVPLTIRNEDSLGFEIYTRRPVLHGQLTSSENDSSTAGTEAVIIGGPVTWPPSSIYMTGISSNRTYIGRSDMPITGIFAKNLYSVGGTVGTLSTSDTRLKKNITKISSVRNKIKSLNVVKYDFTKTLGGEDVSNNPLYKNKTGLLAQEVKDIFPDVVYYNPIDSFYALDYAALIPYLIKSDQEQQDIVASQQEIITSQQGSISTLQNKVERQEQMITELQEQVALLQKQSVNGEISETINKTHKLFQNSPNPFNQSTKIEYILSDNVNNAKLCIYDLNGKQLRCFVLNTVKGASSIEVRASDLQAGIYLYTLIVDNAPVATKRMILTE